MQNAIEILREKGLLAHGCTEFVIRFQDGREQVDLVTLIQEIIDDYSKKKSIDHPQGDSGL